MVVADPLLPAAEHLFGDAAEDLLRVAIEHAGGQLAWARPVQVQHRPGSDLVVRYQAEVAWGAAPARPETLLAAATSTGAPAGTLPLEAEGMQAGVWRYPFDPELPALTDAVTPADGEHLNVVAYRPTRRAVVRRSGPDGTVTYRKVVRPREVASIVAAHTQLAGAGIRVPEVLHADHETGLLTLEELRGQNLRDRLLEHTDGWPAPAELAQLVSAVAAVPPGHAPHARMGLGDATRSHARALAAILPSELERLDRITEATAGLVLPGERDAVLVHGDLYEAQVVVEDGAITGLLDLDDVRLGDPLDDAANMLAHLMILQPVQRRHRDRLARYRQRVRTELIALAGPESAAGLDLRTAAVMVGLATGPFRAQRDRWKAEVRRRLRLADRLVASASEGERTLRPAS